MLCTKSPFEGVREKKKKPSRFRDVKQHRASKEKGKKFDGACSQLISFSEKENKGDTINGVKAAGLREGLPPGAPAAAPHHCSRLPAVGGSPVPRPLLPPSSSSRCGSTNGIYPFVPSQPADDTGRGRGGDVGGGDAAGPGPEEVGGAGRRGAGAGGAGGVPGRGPRAPPRPRGIQGRAAQHRPLPLQGQPPPTLPICLEPHGTMVENRCPFLFGSSHLVTCWHGIG